MAKGRKLVAVEIIFLLKLSVAAICYAASAHPQAIPDAFRKLSEDASALPIYGEVE